MKVCGCCVIGAVTRKNLLCISCHIVAAVFEFMTRFWRDPSPAPECFSNSEPPNTNNCLLSLYKMQKKIICDGLVRKRVKKTYVRMKGNNFSGRISLWLKTLSGDYSDSAIFSDIKACFALILIHSIIIQPFQLSWGGGNNNHLLFMQMTWPLKRSLLADGWYFKWTVWSFGCSCHEILLWFNEIGD